ncbi:MAG TPA: hypothetical protein QF799_00775 [Gammaproteobacteria bacterium]|nr:hypothetical protein [Gammaproteobacteria bacterium]
MDLVVVATGTSRALMAPSNRRAVKAGRAAIALLALMLAACGSDGSGGDDAAGGATAPGVLVPPPPPSPTTKPTMTIVANPAEVTPGSSSTIIWLTTNATECLASNAWEGVRPTQGQEQTGELFETSKFRLVCTGTGGSVSRTLTVPVNANPTPPPLPPAPPANAATLGSEWHPDPDGDGVTDSDNCPNIYNPGQSDSNSDGTGNDCDPGFAPPELNGPVSNLRAENVTPYGAWFNFASPQTTQWGWQAILAWTTDISETGSLAGVQAMIDRGDSVSRLVHEDHGDSLAQPFIVTDMDPDTDYYAVVVHEAWDGLSGEVSNVLAFRTQTGPQLNLGSQHPRVYANTDLISSLRAQYNSGDDKWQAWADELGSQALSAAASSGSGFQSRLFCSISALLYQVTDDDRYRDAALSLFDDNVSFWEGGYLSELTYMFEDAQLGMCLDLLWNELSPAQRERAVLATLLQDEHRVNDVLLIIHDTDDTAGRARSLLIDGLTACGDNGLPTGVASRACAVMDAGLRAWYGQQLPKARRSQGFFAQSGGTLPDGIFYDGGTMGYWYQSFWALHNSGDPVTNYAPYLRHQLQSVTLNALTPSEDGVFTMGDIEAYSNNEANSFQFDWLNQQNYAWLRGLLEISGLDLAAGWSQFILERHFPASGADARSLPMLLFNTDTLAARDYHQDVPLANLDSGMDILLDRTSWSANASQLVFSGGWSGVDHNHADSGHFQLYRRGAWITHEAFGYAGPISWGGGHNTLQLQVHDDRGQYSFNAANTQRIVRASSNSAHSYVGSDLGGAYKSAYDNFDAYDLVQRSLVWLKSDEASTPDTVVIFDQVHNKPSAGSLSRKIRFHLDMAPQISDRTATATSNQGDISQRIEIAAVLPTSSSLDHLGPTGAIPGGWPGGYHTHRVDIDPGTGAQQLVMVSVLRTSNADSFVAMNAAGVDTPQVAGAVIGSEAVLFLKDDLRNTTGAVSLVVDVPSSVGRVWLAGLKPEVSYSVLPVVNGGSISLTINEGSGIATDEGGLLSFELDGGAATATYE